MPRRLAVVHRTQRLRHAVANRVTLPLTILRHLRDGQPVTQRQIAQAIRDLEALIHSLDRNRSNH